MRIKLFVLFLVAIGISAHAQGLRTGAERMDMYLSKIKGKRVAMVVNQTSMVGSVHLADTLKALGISIKAIFAPEHGFRGAADAGEKVVDGKDASTGIPLLSLYGARKKPSSEDLSGVDVLIFDIQDVGLRYYTYISTLHYVMEACAEHRVSLMVLDRPNPNGHFVDGPVLEEGYESFVGKHRIPVVHGMTIGEYARMINGEGWLPGKAKCSLDVIPCTGYDHRTFYQLPVKPSPNLPDMRSIYLYASTCFFEGTVASEGRGTPTPFQVYGHPESGTGDYYFTPESLPGAREPKLLGQRCRGFNLSKKSLSELQQTGRIDLSYLLNFYKAFPDKDNFFIKTGFFDKLAGNNKLRHQIIAGKSEAEIRATWQDGIVQFKKLRKPYLLYKE